MSAYYVGYHHINALLSALRAIPARNPGYESSAFYYFSRALGRMVSGSTENDEFLSDLGRVLLSENLRSLNSRYGQADTMLGGENPNTYVFEATTTLNLTPEVCLKALDCLDYQSCESTDWRGTQAAFIVSALRERFTRRIESVQTASGWSLDDLARPIPKPVARLASITRTRTRSTSSRRIEAV